MNLVKEQLKSHLSSSGVIYNKKHVKEPKVYKRSSSRRVQRKKKLTSTTPSTISATTEIIPEKPSKHNARSLSSPPRDIIKFELNDAKYSAEYEKFRNSRNLRKKRSAENNETKNENDTIYVDGTKFIHPREIFKFEVSDAITTTTAPTEGDKKTKREVDSSANESKKIKIIHPLSSSGRGYRPAKQVAYDDLPIAVRKIIGTTLLDAISKKKANDGDFLKFYYGDRTIKVPMSLAKHISMNPKIKETTSKSIWDFSTKSPEKITKNAFVAYPQLLGAKNAYFPLKESTVPVEPVKGFSSSTTQPKSAISEILNEKPVYYYVKPNDYRKNSMSSPGPVLFESSTPSYESLKSKFAHIPYPMPTTYKDQIPIIEENIENFSPPVAEKSFIPAPTSYIEYNGENHEISHDQKADKNYEFG